MLNLSLFIALLFLGSIAAAAASLFRPRYTRTVALSTASLMLFLWLLLFTQIPLSFATVKTAQSAGQAAWLWHVDRLSWLMSLGLLLLQIGALLLTPQTTGRGPLLPTALTIVLGSSTLFTFWASSLAAVVLSWTLLSLTMMLVLYFNEAETGEPRTLWRGPLRSWIAIFLLWLAAATLPGVELEQNVAAWPTLTKSLALLAIFLQMAVFLLHVWRPLVPQVNANLASLLHVSPVAAGAMLLVRLEDGSDVGAGFALPLTLVGFLGLLAVVREIWSSDVSNARIARTFLLSQASLVLLASVWAGSAAILSEARVLLVGGGLLLLTTSIQIETNRLLPDRIAPLLAAAAIVGLPLTAGFGGRAALYSAWVSQGRWILLLVSVLLHIPIAAAAFLLAWNRAPIQFRLSTIGREELPFLGALLLPALALIGVSGLSETHPIAWIAILLPAAAGIGLIRFHEQMVETRQALREAFPIRLPKHSSMAAVRRLLSATVIAIRQAASLLEGEGGLLWLLVFLVILWLAR